MFARDKWSSLFGHISRGKEKRIITLTISAILLNVFFSLSLMTGPNRLDHSTISSQWPVLETYYDCHVMIAMRPVAVFLVVSDTYMNKL